MNNREKNTYRSQYYNGVTLVCNPICITVYLSCPHRRKMPLMMPLF